MRTYYEHVPQARSLKLPRIRGKTTHLFKEFQYLFSSTAGEVSGEFPQPLQALQRRRLSFCALVAHVEVVVVFGEVGVRADHQTFGREAVATRSADLLVVLLESLGRAIVNHSVRCQVWSLTGMINYTS